MIAGRVNQHSKKEDFIKFREYYNYTDSETLRELLTIAFKNTNEDVNINFQDANTIKNTL
jgi:hypothetical protein